MSYQNWQEEFPIESLRDEAHLDLAIKMLDRLLDGPLTKEEHRYLDHLADMIWEYETVYHSIADQPITPEIVRDLGLEPKAVSKLLDKKPVPLRPSGLFMILAVAGKIPASDIDDWVESWHEGATGEKEYPRLYDYLGMTETEYCRWIQRIEGSDEEIEDILNERRAILTHTEGLPTHYIGAWWKRGNVYRPAPQRPTNPLLWLWLWLTGWRSAHWCAPGKKWKD